MGEISIANDLQCLKKVNSKAVDSINILVKSALFLESMKENSLEVIKFDSLLALDIEENVQHETNT